MDDASDSRSTKRKHRHANNGGSSRNKPPSDQNSRKMSKKKNSKLSSPSSSLIDCTTVLKRVCVDLPTLQFDGGNTDICDEIEEEEDSDCEEFSGEMNGMNELFEPQKFQIDIPKSESYLMFLELILENHMDYDAILGLSELLKVILRRDLLPQKVIDETFNNIVKVEYHALCQKCSKHLGKLKSALQLSHCPHCNEMLEFLNPLSVNYFLVIDPSESLRSLLEKYQDYYHHVVNERQSEENHFKDIYDGYCYQKFLKNLSEDERKQYVTVNISTSGAPRLESSSYSLWPIFMIPNEIPKEHRQPILCGLWFGKHKPNVIPFLTLFTTAFNKFSRNGIECTIKNEKLNVKLFAACVPVDDIARAAMQGLTQPNDYFACNWCEQQGEWEDGVRYSYLDQKAPRRNPEAMLADMENVHRGDACIKGVQSLSPLSQLKYFDIVEGFVPDFVRISLKEVGPQFTEILATYLTPDDIALMDTILLKIKVPNEISQLSVPFSRRTEWTVQEWESWILCHSLPLFSFFLQKKHPEKVEHYSYFVKSLHIILSDDIKKDQLNEAHTMLNKFSKYVQKIYKSLGLKPMTLYLHQMSHVAISVYNWGPVYAHSMLAFESGIIQVLLLILSAKGVMQEVPRFINLQYCRAMLKMHVYPSASAKTKEFSDNYEKRRKFRLKKLCPAFFGRNSFIGKEKLEEFNATVRNSLVAATNSSDEKSSNKQKRKGKQRRR